MRKRNPECHGAKPLTPGTRLVDRDGYGWIVERVEPPRAGVKPRARLLADPINNPSPLLAVRHDNMADLRAYRLAGDLVEGR